VAFILESLNTTVPVEEDIYYLMRLFLGGN